MQNNTSKLNTVLLVIVIILLAVGIWSVLSSKKSTENVGSFDFPTQADLQLKDDIFVQPNIPSKTSQQTDLTPTQSTSNNELKKYSNTNNGFSFDYPSTWRVVSDPLNTNQIKITTSDISMIAEGNTPVPTFSITFKSVDQSFFNPEIATKYGQVTYDRNLNCILIDGQCRATGSVENSSLQGVRYGGSSMSDPATGDSAILTTNKDIIIVHTEMGGPLSDDLRTQIKTIFDSFKLLDGNSVHILTYNN
jgi:hypothetical protein